MEQRTFVIQISGDPFGRCAEVFEETQHGTVYRGDLSGRWAKSRAREMLKRQFPGCIVRDGDR